MRLAAYLCTSRHGIYYFRYPLPTCAHPQGKRSSVKLSIGTREPRIARQVAVVLAAAGQSLLTTPNVRSMRYDQMREHVRDHFSNMLQQFRERRAADGPLGETDLGALRLSQTLADSATDDWLEFTQYEDAKALLRAFCEARGIAEIPDGREADLLLAEVRKGYREFVDEALEHSAEFDRLPLSPRETVNRSTVAAPAPLHLDAKPLDDLISRYFSELERTKALAPKTESDKRDALALMSELTGSKPPANMTRSDAQEVKAALFKLPKNRTKNPRTRDLTLSEMLELSDVERIAARTMNVYLGHMQHFFRWAVDNGYAVENIFQGLRLRGANHNTDGGRKAFTQEQLQLMFAHLTEPASPLVKKDTHKWPALIAMFTGMRLNEVAQLEVQDIDYVDGVWLIEVTPDGDDHKRLKNSSSKRRVPVHRRLEACGFLDFHQSQKDSGQTRLFPDLTYSPQNGYGRNAGRWFNERFLKELGLGGQGLVFHCLRHTMITRLAQAGVEEPLVKAIVGHSQTGVTFSTYFREGFLPAQLSEAINEFDF